jgi:hypothetical protein
VNSAKSATVVDATGATSRVRATHQELAAVCAGSTAALAIRNRTDKEILETITRVYFD